MSRKVKVSICGFREGRGGVSEAPRANDDSGRFDRAMAMARRARLEGADLAVFPEIFLLLDKNNAWDLAEPLDGPLFRKFAENARKEAMFLAVNHPTLIDGVRRNSTVLFNRRGDVEGVYHKTYPTIGELERRVMPGKGAVVLDTEIGRIGFAICYDLNFIELRAAYRDLKPDMTLFSSMWPGGLLTRAWALETRAYLVCAVVDYPSCIVNPVGRVLKIMDNIDDHLTHTLELDCGVFHYDYNNRQIKRLCCEFGKDIDMEPAGAEGVFLLSATGSVPLATVVQAIGLEPAESLFARSRAECRNALAGRFPEVGPPAW
ncbi:MAG: carbon-nitrogen hydrolase family protein [Kiritimatiellaeota bacterium]|nr:carbon-nitrogen hydrolase family protein [Kiritimatiellota bacterium]